VPVVYDKSKRFLSQKQVARRFAMPYPEFVPANCPKCENVLVVYYDKIDIPFMCVHCGEKITINLRAVSNDPQPIYQRHIC
jgi:ribosomal protein S27E